MDGPEAGPGPACGSCGTAIPPGARFCPGCAAPVTETSYAESRRTVTLLFTDVTGSTSLGEELDPEAYRGVMGRYFAVARKAIEHHGGTVEKFVGDAVLSVFGIPEIREDDALRAVRAAHELNERLRELSDDLRRSMGVRLAVRIGVNTGSVVTGAARAGGSFATGDAVNTAARLEQAAQAGQILIGAETYALVRDAVEAVAVEPVLAKGKAEPVPAYRLLSVSGDSPGRSRRLRGPLLGRDRETRALEDALARTIEHGRGHLVTVLGAPGLGKTRLISDFTARAEDRAEVVSGRCVSYGDGITFWPIVQVIRQAVGLGDDEPDPVIGEALRDAMAGAPDGSMVADLLLPLLGRGGDAGGSEETAWAVRRLLEQLASRRPLVVAVDDLHWAEPALLALLQQVHEEVSDLPLLLVCQARLELLEEHPDWGHGSLNSTTFALETLTRDQVAGVIASMLDGGADDSAVDAVVAWSGGNPLFVEEMTSHLVEAGLVARSGNRWEVTGDLSEAAVPPTVAALLAARLARLPPPERLLLERVSVIGLELSTDDALGMTSDSAPEVSTLLSALARRDLLQRVRDSGREAWAFRHIMIRDAAYSSLPKAQRAELHESFADSIAAGPSAGAETIAFVAHHLHEAAGYRRELAPHDPATDSLVTRAVDSLVEAAAQARDRDDHRGAVQLLQRAVDLGPDAGPLRRDLLLLLIQSQQDQRMIGAAGETVDLLEAATDETATELDRAAVRVELLNHRVDVSEDYDLDELEREARRLTDLARGSGDNLRLRRGLSALLVARSLAGQWKEVMEMTSELADVGGPLDARRRLYAEGAALMYGPYAVSDLRGTLAQGWSGVGTPRGASMLAFIEAVCAAAAGEADARDRFEQAVELITAVTGALDSDERSALADVCVIAGWGPEAIAWTADAAEAYRADGDLAHGSTCLAWLACLTLEQGLDPDRARRQVDEAEEWTSPHDVVSVALVAAARCMLAGLTGDHASASDLGRRAVETVDRTDQAWQQADVRRWVSMSARERGDREAERLLLTDALDLYRIKEMTHYISLLERRLAELA